MKVLQINTFCGSGGSTGRIVVNLYNILKEHGHECVVAYGRKFAPDSVRTVRVGTNVDIYRHALFTRITDRVGFYSAQATRKFVKKIEQYSPDVIHLHNIHGYYINIEVLFEYLARANKPVVWTLHDCWAFTGHCPYFDYIGCDRWKTGCYKCPQKKEYPKSGVFDNSRRNYEQKKKLFTSVKDMTIVTPSVWLAELVKQSFLGKYQVRVINNGIDLDIFRSAESNFKERYKITNKCVILGVASVWDRRKGLDAFIELSKMLEDSYKVVLVGLSDKQMCKLPENILGFTRTESVRELTEIYTMADVFVNPSVEETQGLTTVEALACGTPVIVYNATALPESVDSSCGVIVEKGNVNAMKAAVEEIRNGNMFDKSDCINRAKLYDKQDRFGEYVQIYKSFI